MKPTEYPLRPGDADSHWCLARHNLLAELEAEGYRFYREGDVPEWMKVAATYKLTEAIEGQMVGPRQIQLYRNTKAPQ